MKKTIEVYSYKGALPGPKVLVIGAIHGNEECGAIAIREFVKDVNLIKGELCLIVANKKALEKDVRYVEKDLNRQFEIESDGSYESDLATQIKPFLDWADILLDLHASNATNSEPFIIAEGKGLEYTKYLFPKNVVVGITKYHPGATDGYMYLRDKAGICVECGSSQSIDSIDNAKKVLSEFLSGVGLINGEQKEYSKTELNIFECFTGINDFTLSKPFADFEKIRENDLIGYDGVIPIRAPKDCYIIFARNQKVGRGEAFVLLD